MITSLPPQPPPPLLLAPPVKKTHWRLFATLFVIALIGLAANGIISRATGERDLKKSTQASAVPVVAVLIVEKGNASEDIVLPGTVQAWHEATIYARTSGYLKSWVADIGTHVKEGDKLAEIDAPDLDAQLHQAQADLATAVANNQLAQVTAQRWAVLLKSNSVSKQDADTKMASAAASQAMADSQKANLDHLEQLEEFKKVIAPFDGTVTQRNTDVGALINGDSNSGAGQDLFHIAQTDKLRVYVQVPENNASMITPETMAELSFPQDPQQKVTAKLSHTANALDPVTRTLLIELQVDNSDGCLLAGGYTDAHIKIATAKDTVILPVSALLFRDGMHIGVVKDNHISLKAVTLGRDYGKTVEITAGIEVGDQVVLNPPDSLEDGEEVQIAKPEDKDADKDKKEPTAAKDKTHDAK